MIKNNEITYIPEEVSEISNNNYLMLLKCIDIVISSLIVAPCVIAYWRGTWQLMELLILPKNKNISALVSFAVGSFGHMFFTLCQDSFKKSFHPDKKRLTYYIASRSYTAVFGIVCVNMWRGVWNLCDNFTSQTSLEIIILTTLISLISLVIIKAMRNLTAPPFVVSVDHSKMYFEISTIFNTKKYRRPVLYFLDTYFSAIVVGTLVVIAWRGVWEIWNLTFYRNDDFVSAVGSLIVGYGIVGITFALQPILGRTCRNVNGTLKLALADSYYLISFVGGVNVWRGIWMFLDLYLYPEDQLKSCYVSHAISFIILAVLNCANSILVRGLAIDGEEVDNNSCVEFPIAFVKLHFQNKRTRKYTEKNRNRNDGKNKLKEQELLVHT